MKILQGEVHTICQTNSPPFNVDVLRYLEPEHVYKVPLGHYVSSINDPILAARAQPDPLKGTGSRGDKVWVYPWLW